MDTTSAIHEQSAPTGEPLATSRKPRLIVAGALLLLIAVAIVAVVIEQRGNDGETAAGANNTSTQRVEGGNVTVAATWLGVAAGPVFEVALDTHSVDLDKIDLSQLAVLRINGVEVQPASWDAPKGGHHREGQLAFPDTAADGSQLIDANTSTVELVIRDVAGVDERTYRWNP